MHRYSVRTRVGPLPGADALRVWRDGLAEAGEDVARRFDWLARQVPEGPPAVHELVDADGAVVGAACVGCREFRLDGRTLRAALHTDLAVARGHRTLLPALTLVRAVQADALDRRDFGYGFPNRASRGVFARARYAPLGSPVRYARVLRHAPYVARALGATRGARAIGALVDVADLLASVPAALDALAGYRLAWLDRVGPGFDALWSAAAPEYDVVGRRDAAFLRWRFVEQPRACARFAALLTHPGGALSAYAVVREDGTTARLRDLFGHRAALGPLLDLLLPALRLEGFTSTSFQYLGAPAVVELLRARGFRPREHEAAVVFDAPGHDPEVNDLAAARHRWHLTEADGDT